MCPYYPAPGATASESYHCCSLLVHFRTSAAVLSVPRAAAARTPCSTKYPVQPLQAFFPIKLPGVTAAALEASAALPEAAADSAAAVAVAAPALLDWPTGSTVVRQVRRAPVLACMG
eukprot:1043191-Pelagomonas_calceolata.AAC.5